MKRSAINRIIDKNDPIGFSIENDYYMIVWYVAIGDGKMVARREVELNDHDGVHEDYWTEPYADMDRCKEIYDAVVTDFVGCYGEDLYYGTAGDLSVFSDFGGPDDDGLLELLGVFGKTYAEFLLDVFLEFGNYVDEYSECAEDGCGEADDEERLYNENAHLVKSVLRHSGKASLCISYDDRNAVTYWEFAEARGEIWYHRADYTFDGDNECECTYHTDEYGHYNYEDIDGVLALRDVVQGCFAYDNYYCEDEGDALALIGLKPEDLEDD